MNEQNIDLYIPIKRSFVLSCIMKEGHNMFKKYIIFIVSFFIMLSGCVSQDMQNTNDKVYQIDLMLYGKSNNIENYSTQDHQIIDKLVDKINLILLNNQQLGNEKDFDIPKGISYELKVIGEQSIEYRFINGYLIYNHDVFKVNQYQSIIQLINNSFNIDS